MNDFFLPADWPAPDNIFAGTTLRVNNYSKSEFDLAPNKMYSQENRTLLNKVCYLPTPPLWIKQEHTAIAIPALSNEQAQIADASYTDQTNMVCAVLTADCLPLLVCNRQGTQVAAIHAGWRGLAAGVIENTLLAMACNYQDLLVWLGPAINACHYEVGDEVKVAFMQHSPEAEQAFTSTRPGHYLADLYILAKLRLRAYGITSIFGGNFCTYHEERFFSYRRDGMDAGRMASLIWLAEQK